MTLFVHRNAGGRCPCGAANAACGPPSDVVPVDLTIEEVAAVSGPLKKYRVRTANGVDTVLKLSEADAAKLGDGPYEVSDAASTIEPVQPVDIVTVVSTDPVSVATVAEPVQPPPADNGPIVADPAAPVVGPGDDPTEPQPVRDEPVPTTEPTPAPVPAPAPVAAPVPTPEPVPAKAAPTRKRAAASENKARRGAANKAAGSGS